MPTLQAVIGLEIHVQLSCATKMFCSCPNRPGDEPNRNTCPICLWLPGNLPRFSAEALEKATLACLALNCRIQKESAFDQKVYYYPDLPKGYQLSQFHRPLARNGWLDIVQEDETLQRIRIQKIHMEEDVARLVHEKEGKTTVSLVDFNRAGTPLVEIVTEPDLRTPADAMEFLRTLRMQLRYSQCSTCSMEQGTMRVDANVSVRPSGSNVLNAKVEIKNMNSIRHVGDAVAHEIRRQESLAMSKEPIVTHTRLWDPEARITSPMREKFEGPCVPDPSVPPIVISEKWLREMIRNMPEMPGLKAERYMNRHGLTREEALQMSAERNVSCYFESALDHQAPPRLAAQWIAAQLPPLLKDREETLENTPLDPQRFAGLLLMLEREEINANAAREVLRKLCESTASPAEIVVQCGCRQVSEADELEALVDRVILENASAVENFRQGASKALGFLMGRAMQASGGKANPRLLKELMTSKLKGDGQ
ncbi:MAG TPA: Asp-tRNA(Asn)/Glu-tRNA(Gln) amidotransferase subunit GatB [Desulfonatronum sp.]|nr:Asp-tRNA(Asn)/Glu-tRNA(Gln) amidotransferase subunit GatB [Desulfonatronum sp.]